MDLFKQNLKNGKAVLDIDIMGLQRILIKNMLHVHIASVEKRIESCERCPIICENPAGFEAEDKIKIEDALVERNRMRNYPNLPSGTKLPYYEGLKNRLADVERITDTIKKSRVDDLRERLHQSRLNELAQARTPHSTRDDEAEIGAERDELRCRLGTFQTLLEQRDSEISGHEAYTVDRQREISTLKQHLRNAEEKAKRGEKQQSTIDVLEKRLKDLTNEGTRRFAKRELEYKEHAEERALSREEARKQATSASGKAKKRIEDLIAEKDKRGRDYEEHRIGRAMSREKVAKQLAEREKTIEDLRNKAKTATGASKRKIEELIEKHQADMIMERDERKKSRDARNETIEGLKRDAGAASGSDKAQIEQLITDLETERTDREERVLSREAVDVRLGTADREHAILKAKHSTLLETTQKMQAATGVEKEQLAKEVENLKKETERLETRLAAVEEEADEFVTLDTEKDAEIERKDAEIERLNAEHERKLKEVDDRYKAKLDSRDTERAQGQEFRMARVLSREQERADRVASRGAERTEGERDRTDRAASRERERTERAASRERERSDFSESFADVEEKKRAVEVERDAEEKQRRDAQRERDFARTQLENRRVSRERERAATAKDADRMQAELHTASVDADRMQAEIDQLRQRPRSPSVVAGTGSQADQLEGIAEEQKEPVVEEVPEPVPAPAHDPFLPPVERPVSPPSPPHALLDDPFLPPAPRPISPPPRPAAIPSAPASPFLRPAPRPRRRRHTYDDETSDSTDDNVPLDLSAFRIQGLIDRSSR